MIGDKTPTDFEGYSNAYGHYSHQTIGLSAPSVTIYPTSISVSPTLFYKTATNNPSVQFYID